MKVTRSIDQTPQSTWRTSRGPLTHLLALAREHREGLRGRWARRAIRDLSAEQLKDIGLEPPPDGRLEVSAGLMARLMSMA
ncbi:MAG: hypothetical protein MUE79_03495 [Nitratireductor sp.]|nr:hypothetical protein [Nitratireductor sp.]